MQAVANRFSKINPQHEYVVWVSDNYHTPGMRYILESVYHTESGKKLVDIVQYFGSRSEAVEEAEILAGWRK